jgi:uncharacterized SAM-binding protein YcdF (DUF218 family)
LNVKAIPTGNTSATHFDTIIVLGFPAWDDGRPSPEQRERVMEGVREYKAGIAPRIIMTGGAAHNQFVEAHVMARLAAQQGVPEADIIEEPQAMNTIQNIYYSSQIMHAHGWHSAEVVSSSAHISRAAMILLAMAKKHPELTIQWRTRAALWPRGYKWRNRLYITTYEDLRCLLIRVAGFPDSKFLPR